mmetsp:Transcript_14213/g.1276  ORF Transcript_14213/g.1276 Transcript_14213/m.1276 type:complete len:112 (-) Transcript_14213:217-552(-)
MSFFLNRHLLKLFQLLFLHPSSFIYLWTLPRIHLLPHRRKLRRDPYLLQHPHLILFFLYQLNLLYHIFFFFQHQIIHHKLIIIFKIFKDHLLYRDVYIHLFNKLSNKLFLF